MQQGILDWEDRDIFFDEFAVDATLQIRGSGATLNLRGILDTPYQQRAFGAFVVDADDPSFICKWVEELEQVRVGDKLTIGTEEFYLDSLARSDGTGMVSFTLTRESTQDDQGDEPPENYEAPVGGGLFGPNPLRS